MARAPRKMIARYAGSCGDCAEPIKVGDAIVYGGRGRVVHDNGECTLDQVEAGPTTRERRMARADRLEGWSESNAAKSNAEYAQSRKMMDVIPFGQPILVGHYSEGRDRRYRDRAWNKLGKASQLDDKAREQARRADSIRAATDGSIFDDDPDAIERLTERIDELTAERDAMKAENAEFRKAHREELKGKGAYAKDQMLPHASFSLSNRTANIGRYRKRLERLLRERGAA